MQISTLLPLAAAVSFTFHAQAQVPPERACTWVTTLDTGPLPAQGAIGGMASDPLGRVYSANFRSDVWRIESDGTAVLLSDEFVNASGCTVAGNGDLIQCDYATDEVYRIHENGARTLVADSGLDGPVGIAQAPGGELSVVNYRNDTISCIDLAGNASLFSDDDLLNGPNGIVIDGYGNIFVCNLKNNRVLTVDSAGRANILATSPGKKAHLTLLNGKLYVSAIWRHVVYEVAMDGSMNVVAGIPGVGGIENGCASDGLLSHPNGITAGRDGRLYTNNFVGFMGGSRGQIWVRAITLQ